MDSSLEPFSDHPLFRALVLMGGGLAVSCGGIAQSDRQGTSSSAGAPDGAVAGGSAGGPTIIIGGPASSGATSTGGASDVDAGVPPLPDCPYAQWDCTTKQPACYLALTSALDPLQSNCYCDATRPRTADDCGPKQTLVCLQAFTASATPGWDGSVHVQCSCVDSPTPSYANCGSVCGNAFPEAGQMSAGRFLSCLLPSSSTCDASGVCTATSADVLRQDGIMCGCADVGLK